MKNEKKFYYPNSGSYIDNPMSQENLLPKIKLQNSPNNPIPINTYNFREENIFCYACGRHNHFKGITIDCGNNQLALIGNCCAKSFFGTDAYARLKRQIKRMTDNAYLISRTTPILEGSKNALIELEQLVHLSSEVEICNRKLRSNYPDLYKALLDICHKGNGRFVIKYRHKATDPSKKNEQSIVQSQITGYIRGQKFIANGHDTQSLHEKLMTNCRYIVLAIENGENLDELMPRIHRVFYDDCSRDSQNLIETLNAAAAFSSDENLRNIGDWAESERIDRLLNYHLYQPSEIRKATTAEQKLRKIIPFGFEKPKGVIAKIFESKSLQSTS